MPPSEAQMLGGHDATLKNHEDRIGDLESARHAVDATLSEFRGAFTIAKWVLGFVGGAQGLNILIELSKLLNK